MTTIQKAIDCMNRCPLPASRLEQAIDKCADDAIHGTEAEALISGLALIGLATYKKYLTEKYR